jgi:hypothetical protein
MLLRKLCVHYANGFDNDKSVYFFIVTLYFNTKLSNFLSHFAYPKLRITIAVKRGKKTQNIQKSKRLLRYKP